MKSPLRKSRSRGWLPCLEFAAIVLLSALPQPAAAGQASVPIHSFTQIQYYPYDYPPGDNSPYEYAPNQGLPGDQWPYSDSDIRRTVRSQFVLDTFLDAINIRFRVQDGVVILTGRVKTWDNRYRAEIDAYGAGARVVLNQLKVLPY